MIRPGAMALLTRWREALAGGLALALGGWLWLGFRGLPALFGLAALLVGLFLVISGVRAARFRTGARSPGIVGVDEGRITYMGPLTGGLVELDELTQVAFHRPDVGDAYWRLSQRQGEALVIPEGAIGSDRLLDALAPLPGLDAGAMVRAVQTRDPGAVTVWRRAPLRALT